MRRTSIKLASLIRNKINEEELDWDQEGDIDTSMDEYHTKLQRIHREMDLLFKRFKSNQIGKEDYIVDRKALQQQRDDLEALLLGEE